MNRENDNPWGGNPWGGNPWGGNPWRSAGPFGGRNFRILSGLRRDPFRGKISGVCAGIAGYYGLNANVIRALMILAGFINPVIAIGSYAVATFLLRPLPDPRDFVGQSEFNVGSSTQTRNESKAEDEELPLELRIAAIKDKFRDLETRTGEIETLVTSPEFHLRRDFRKMGEA